MLDNYQKEQPIAYSILKNAFQNKKIGHAFLFYSNSLSYAKDFALAFAKTLLCPFNRLNNGECVNCLICQRIDNCNYPEIKIIEPDGLWIKKDQLDDLKADFKSKSLEGDKKVYIIVGCDKLNAQAANSILKFLEEPEQNIVAILITNDKQKTLPTIISRCQILGLIDGVDENVTDLKENINATLLKIGQLYYKNDLELIEFINREDALNKLNMIVSFINEFETSGINILCEINSLFSKVFIDKNDYIWAFDMMVLFYRDVINNIYNRKIEIFDCYIDAIKNVSSRNDVQTIIYKLQKILSSKEKIKYNINTDLLIDKLLIDMGSGD